MKISFNALMENKKWLFYVWCLLLIAWCVFVLFSLTISNNRYVFDPADFSAYFERGKWAVTHEIPLSEYPQIPTYLFGIDFFLASLFSTNILFGAFYSIFSLEMIVALFFTIKILSEILPTEKKQLCLLMLFPPTLYFVLNRFDILPVLICLIALKNIKRKRWELSSIVLAIATFTKWYPVLLIPRVFMYASVLENKIQWKIVIYYFIASVIIVLPTLILGGIDAVIYPYQLHVARDMEFVALPLLIYDLLRSTQLVIIFKPTYFLLFFIIQVVSPISAFFMEIPVKSHTHSGLIRTVKREK